jgi:hypothetical protein
MALTKEQLGLKEYIVTGNKLVANIIYEATIALSLPRLPRNAEIIVEKVREVYRKEFKQSPGSEFHIRTFGNYDELVNWIKEHIMTIPEIRNLNLSDSEVERGVTVNDVNRGKFYLTSRFDGDPDPKDDFIDLGAYARNLAHSLMRENIEINYSTF